MRRRSFLRTGLAAAAAGALPGLRPDPLAGVTAGPRPRAADGVLRLNANENPLGIPASARAAIADALGDANRYPLEVAVRLRDRIARHHGVPGGAVVLGNGSTEVLQMTVQALASPGTRIVVPDPTFEDVDGYADPFGLDPVRVPLRADWSHDVGAMRAATRGARGTVLVYVCNPNNPTGSLTSCDELEAWIEEAPEDHVFLVDEAYFEYVTDPGYRPALALTQRRPNVVVTRTFSKIYGMAGLRLGYAVAHPSTAARIGAWAAGVNANHLAIAAAEAALGDDAYLRESLETNRAARGLVEATLDELGLERIPSHTNFVMHRIRPPLDAYIRAMREEGIRVGRPFPPLLEWNRLSMGLPAEMQRWAATLRELRGRGLA